jgi:translation initiation factor 5
MPKMQLTTESRGNGIKTNIFNIEDVAVHLRVPSKAIMKHLCSELGANMEQTSIVKGKHTYDVMLKHLDKFIEKYVLCKNCHYPELQRFLEGKSDLKSKCNACGTSNKHDSMSQAGKVFINELKSGKTQVVDITSKDKAGEKEDVEHEISDDDGTKKDKKKKEKKDKKDKKKKNKGETKDDEEEEKVAASGSDDDISDLDEEVTYKSRRISKYTFNSIGFDNFCVVCCFLDEYAFLSLPLTYWMIISISIGSAILTFYSATHYKALIWKSIY